MTKTTDHDLLVRIDERQYGMTTQINTIVKKIECMVPNDTEYQELKVKVESLWDSKNKMIGWMIGAGVAGGGISTVFSGLVKDVLAYWK
jgi:hypothetical protein